MIGNKTVKHYTRKRRVITTDFDGNVSYGEWRIIGKYEEVEDWESSKFELYKYYKATYNSCSSFEIFRYNDGQWLGL